MQPLDIRFYHNYTYTFLFIKCVSIVDENPAMTCNNKPILSFYKIFKILMHKVNLFISAFIL